MRNTIIILLFPLFSASQAVVDKDGNITNYTKLADSTKYFASKYRADSIRNAITDAVNTNTANIATKQNTLVSGTNIKTVNGTTLLGSGDIAISGAVAWGNVTGTLANQTDLQTALAGKQATGSYLVAADIAGKQNTITTGTTAQYFQGNLSLATFPTTTASFSNSTDKNFVTDAKQTVLTNTSGTNTGDNSVNTTYANDFRAANFVAGTNYLAPNGSAALLTSFPILNQNTTGTASNVTGVVSFASGGIGAGAATSATTGTITVTMNTEMITVTPTGAMTFNASGGVTGQRITFVVTTSGVTSFVLTFGTAFKTVGTLATGTTTAKIFCISFLFNGATWLETSRTTAM